MDLVDRLFSQLQSKLSMIKKQKLSDITYQTCARQTKRKPSVLFSGEQEAKSRGEQKMIKMNFNIFAYELEKQETM